VEALQPDQVAGLAAAALLAEQRTPAEHRSQLAAGSVGFLLVMSLVLVAATLLASAPFAGYVALLLFIGAFPAGIVAWLVHRQSIQREQAADARVALAMEEPARLLHALRRMEELEPKEERRREVAARRERLERRLGLEGRRR
jgi:hypothetical protein